MPGKDDYGLSSPSSFYHLLSSPNNQNFGMPLHQSPHHHQPFSPFDPSLRGRQGMPLHGDNSALYRMSEITSPGGPSFHLSGMDTSGIIGGGRNREDSLPSWKGGAGDLGVKDLNNYLPMHKIKFPGDYPRRLYTVENSVTRETIVVVACTQKIMLFVLKIKGDDHIKTPGDFEFVKFHELYIQPNELEAFAISQNCSITLAPLKLTYALSTKDGKIVYLYDQGEGNSATHIPPELNLEEVRQEAQSAEDSSHMRPSQCLTRFQHDYPVSHLAIDSEKPYLACIQELGTIVVWEIRERVKLAVFNIPQNGIYISFHRSEPYQLMVIDSSGWARFFNVFRQCCFRSINLVQQNVFSAEWSPSNSNVFAAGFAESFAVIDTCKVLTSMNKCYEAPEQIINAVKINPTDDKVLATLSRSSGMIQLWRDNFSTQIWKHRNAHVNDIAWVHGYPFLLALGHQTLFIYDASMV